MITEFPGCVVWLYYSTFIIHTLDGVSFFCFKPLEISWMDNKATVEFVCPIMKNYASMDLGGVVYNAFSICINLHIFASRIQPLSQGSLLLVLGNEAGPLPVGNLVALGRPQWIGCENNEQTKLIMEPSPKTKKLRPIGVQLNKRFWRAARMLRSGSY